MITFESNSSLESVRLGAFSFIAGPKKLVLPNAEEVTFDDDPMECLPESAKILIKRGAKLSGKGLNQIKNRIGYIKSHSTTTEEEPKKKHQRM